MPQDETYRCAPVFPLWIMLRMQPKVHHGGSS